MLLKVLNPLEIKYMFRSNLAEELKNNIHSNAYKLKVSANSRDIGESIIS